MMMLKNQHGSTTDATASTTTLFDGAGKRRKQVVVVFIIEEIAIVVDVEVDVYNWKLRCIMIFYDRHNNDGQKRSVMNILLLLVAVADVADAAFINI